MSRLNHCTGIGIMMMTMSLLRVLETGTDVERNLVRAIRSFEDEMKLKLSRSL